MEGDDAHPAVIEAPAEASQEEDAAAVATSSGNGEDNHADKAQSDKAPHGGDEEALQSPQPESTVAPAQESTSHGACMGMGMGAPPGQAEPAASSPSIPSKRSPGYQAPTVAQPKPVLEGYTHAEDEHVAAVFSAGNAFSRGIRSLPDALAPGFRERLYDEIIEAGKREKAVGRSQAPFTTTGAGSAPVPPAGTIASLASGQRSVPRVHPYSGSFASYEYMMSEYERPNLISKFERLKHKLQQMSPSEFVVKATPQAPRGAPSFCEFVYVSNPVMLAEAARQAQATAHREACTAGPFLAGGRVDAGVNLRGLADECMMGICKVLSADWPASFLQVFEDSSGAIVLCFDKVAAVGEGDLSAYMQNMVRSSRLVAEFRLVKDAAQWGLLDSDTHSVFFVLWPPWVRHRYLGEAAAPSPAGAGAAEQPLAA